MEQCCGYTDVLFSLLFNENRREKCGEQRDIDKSQYYFLYFRMTHADSGTEHGPWLVNHGIGKGWRAARAHTGVTFDGWKIAVNANFLTTITKRAQRMLSSKCRLNRCACAETEMRKQPPEVMAYCTS